MKKRYKRKIERLNKTISDLHSDIQILLHGSECEKMGVKIRYELLDHMEKVQWQGTTEKTVEMSKGFLDLIEIPYNKES
jgi:hypothetical protein